MERSTRPPLTMLPQQISESMATPKRLVSSSAKTIFAGAGRARFCGSQECKSYLHLLIALMFYFAYAKAAEAKFSCKCCLMPARGYRKAAEQF